MRGDSTSCHGGRSLLVVAHPDDDLLFMSPDLLRTIDAKRCLRTVYLTAGDAGADEGYWGEREAGIRAAYASMAGMPNQWALRFLVHAGLSLRLYSLVSAPRVSVLFVRLPDGRSRGQGFERYGFASLEKLWRQQIPSLTTVDHGNELTRDGLIGALAGIIVSFRPDTLSLLDPMRYHGDEHSDHAYAARFAFEAQKRLTSAHRVRIYRDYNIAAEPVNLSPDEQRQKWMTFLTYAEHDRLLCHGGTSCLASGPYFQWSQREYAIDGVIQAGSLRSSDGGCLTVLADGSAVPRVLGLTPCQDLPQQHWALTGNGELRGLDGRCLVPDGGGDREPRLDACIPHGESQWSLAPDARLRLEGRCLVPRASGLSWSGCETADSGPWTFVAF